MKCPFCDKYEADDATDGVECRLMADHLIFDHGGGCGLILSGGDRGNMAIHYVTCWCGVYMQAEAFRYHLERVTGGGGTLNEHVLAHMLFPDDTPPFDFRAGLGWGDPS